jgi:hypothetical protein
VLCRDHDRFLLVKNDCAPRAFFWTGTAFELLPTEETSELFRWTAFFDRSGECDNGTCGLRGLTKGWYTVATAVDLFLARDLLADMSPGCDFVWAKRPCAWAVEQRGGEATILLVVDGKRRETIGSFVPGKR